MGQEHEKECFNNPLILYSEHKRVLTDAVKRGDERTIEAERRGFYRGLANASLLTVIVAVIAAIAGFNFGLSFNEPTGLCVPLYDYTGYERCQ